MEGASALGHVVGDRLLQSIGQRLLASVRRTDTVSRQGGDEFVVLLAEVARIEDASRCAETILAALREPHHIDEHRLLVTARIGIAIFPDDGANAQTLLQRADAAMYQAKAGGRNAYRFFREEMSGCGVDPECPDVGSRRALGI